MYQLMYQPVTILKIKNPNMAHKLNELGIFVGDKVYDLGKDYYKTTSVPPIVFRTSLNVEN